MYMWLNASMGSSGTRLEAPLLFFARNVITSSEIETVGVLVAPEMLVLSDVVLIRTAALRTVLSCGPFRIY